MSRRSQLPERYQKILISGGFGSLVGVALGALLWRSYWAIAIGSVLGSAFGYLIVQILPARLSLESFSTLENRLDLLLGFASVLLALLGVVGFLVTWRLEVALSAGFFGVCAICLLAFAKAQHRP